MSPNPSAPILELRNVTQKYGQVVAVDDVSLDIPDAPGGVALIGESGSGKTTLARILLGLVAPSSGQVLYKGEELGRRAKSRRFRAEVQPVFQDGNEALDPRMRIGAAVAEGLRSVPRRRRAARVAELLEEVGLDPALADRFPHRISGGQRQRVIIARALAMGPAALVLDEPTSALDVTVQAKIIELIERLRDEHGLRVLLITHNLGVAWQLCTTAHVLLAGRVVESGSIRELLDAPKHPYTAALVAAVPVLGGEPPSTDSAWQPPAKQGCSFSSRCPFATDLCREQRPDLRPVGGQLVACHHAERIADSAQ